MNIEGLRGNSLEGYNQYNQVTNLSVDNLTVNDTISIPNLPISTISNLTETIDSINNSFDIFNSCITDINNSLETIDNSFISINNILETKQNTLIAGNYISIVDNLISVDVNASVSGGGSLNTLQGSDNISVFNGCINLKPTINVSTLNASTINFSNSLPISKIVNLQTTLDNKLNTSDILSTIQNNNTNPVQSTAIYNRIVSLESDVVTNLNLTETYKNNACLYRDLSKTYSENACDYMDLAEGYKNNACSYMDTTLSYRNSANTYKNQANTASTNASKYSLSSLTYKNETETLKQNTCVYVDNCCVFADNCCSYLDQMNQLVGSSLKGSNNISINTCGEINLSSSISTTNISSSFLRSSNVSIGNNLTVPNVNISSVYCDTLNTKGLNISASNAKLKLVDIVGNSPSIEFVQGYTTDFGGDVIADWKIGSDIDGYLSFSRANTDFYNGEVLQLNRDGNIYARYGLNVSTFVNASSATFTNISIPSNALNISNVSGLITNLNNKQNVLIAGDGINICNNVISSTGGGTDTLNVSTLNASIINFSNSLPISKITSLQTSLDNKLNTSDILTTIQENSSYPVQSTAIYNRIVSLESDVVTNLNLTSSYATNSSNYSLSSLTYATNSSNYSISSKNYRDESLTYATNSSNYSISSKNYRDQSLTYATNSSIYSLSSLTYSNNAMSYRNSANTHQLNTCSYMDLAYSYMGNSCSFADDAKGHAILAGVEAGLAGGSALGAGASALAASGSATAASGSANSAENSANNASTYRGQALGYRNEASNYAGDANEYSIDARDYASNSSRYMHNSCSYMDNTCGYMVLAEDYKDDALLSRQQANTYKLNCCTYKDEISVFNANCCSYNDNCYIYASDAFNFKNNACYYADQAKIDADASRFLTGSDNITIDPADGEINLSTKISVTNISSTNISALTEMSAPFGKFTTIYNSTINTSYFNMSCANATLKIIDLDNNVPCIQLIHGNNPIYGADATTDWKFQTNINGNLFIERANNATYNGAVLNFSPNGDILANHNLSVMNAVTSNIVNANIVTAEESNFSTINTCSLNATTQLEFAIDTFPVMTLTTTPKQIEDDYGDIDTIECANLDLPYGDITAQNITLVTANIVDLQIPNESLTITKIDGLQTALDSKQGTLTAGTNITINGNTISATATPLTGTSNISVFNGSVRLNTTINISTINSSTANISTLTIPNNSLTIAKTNGLQTALDSKQGTLTAGSNISINGNTISATATPLTGTSNISVFNGSVRLNTTINISTINSSTANISTLTIPNNSLTIAKTNGLQTALDSKQGTLTAGTNVSIVNNVISATSSNSLTGSSNISVFNSSINLSTTISVTNINSTGDIASTGRIIITGQSPTLYLREQAGSTERSGMIHMNANLMYFLSGVNNSTSWSQTANSRWPLYLNTLTNEAVFGGNISCPTTITTSSMNSTNANISVITLPDNALVISKISGLLTALNGKQATLTAGTGITIDQNNQITATTSGSLAGTNNISVFNGSVDLNQNITITNKATIKDIETQTLKIKNSLGSSKLVILDNTTTRNPMIEFIRRDAAVLSGSDFGVDIYTDWRIHNQDGNLKFYRQDTTNNGESMYLPYNGGLVVNGLIQGSGIISRNSACITSYANNQTYAQYAQFSHKDVSANGTSYALLSENNGETYLNAGNGRTIRFRINNSDIATLDASKFQTANMNATTFTGTYSNVYSLNSTYAYGSTECRGANAIIRNWVADGNFAVFGHSSRIGNSNEYCLIHGVNGGTYLNCNNGQQLEFRRNNAYRLKLDSDGSGTFAGWCRATALKTYSDDRLKHNEIDINGLEIVRQLNPKKYDKTFEPIYDVAGNAIADYHGEIEKEHFQEAGFVAQEVLKTDISWVVSEPSKCSEEGTFEPYTVDYNCIMTYGIQAIKELDIIVQRLEKRIGDLEAENDLLTSRVEELETATL